MKTHSQRLMLLVALSILTLTSCSKTEKNFSNQPSSPSFYASIEENDYTKTALDDNLHLCWTADDRISIWAGKDCNEEYKFMGNTGDHAGRFDRVAEGDVNGISIRTNYALYPYSESNSISVRGVITASLPSRQPYSESSFGQKANLMVAATSSLTDYHLSFKNICGFLKLQITGTASIKSITINGNNLEPIAGTATITAAFDATPYVTMETDISSVVLFSSEGVQLNATTPTDFYIVLPPTTFTNGICLTIKDTENNIMVKRSSASLTISRNTIQSMTSFTYAPTQSGNIPIPDPVFKTYLVTNFDTDGDGEISMVEAAVVTRIDCHKSKNFSPRPENINTRLFPENQSHKPPTNSETPERIRSLSGIEYFSSLQYLDCGGNDITELNLVYNTALREVNCWGNLLTSLDLTGCNNLKILDCCFNINMGLLDVSSCPLLEELICFECKLTFLNIKNNAALSYLDCSYSQLTSLNISSNTALLYLGCGYNQLTSLNLSNNIALSYLDCSRNRLTLLDVSNAVALSSLGCVLNRLTSLDLSSNTLLEFLYCSDNQLTTLDVSNSPLLSYLWCDSNPNLTTLWLKTGQTIDDEFIYDDSVTTIYYK